MASEEEQDVRTRMMVRAWKDPDFRALVRTDPRAAMVEMGADVPPNMTIIVV